MKQPGRQIGATTKGTPLRLSKTAVATIALLVLVATCMVVFPARTPLPRCQATSQTSGSNGKGCYTSSSLTPQDFIWFVAQLIAPVGGGAAALAGLL
jgi:hypothetical protein